VAHEHTRPDEFEGPPMISVQLALRSHGTAVHASISTHVVPLFTRPLGHTHVSPSPVIEVSARADVCVCVCVCARACACACVRAFVRFHCAMTTRALSHLPTKGEMH
jgi:hypothetical protein